MIPRAVRLDRLVLAIVATAAMTTPVSAQRYRLVEVGTLPGHGNSYPVSINDGGAVLSYALDLSVSTPFVWHAGKVRILPFLDPREQSAIPRGLNNDGDAVGWSATAFQGHAVLWPAGGGIIDLDPPGANESDANALNDSRLVVGFARNWRSFTWENGNWTDFYDAGWRSINNLGQMVGVKDGDAVIWENSELHTLPNLRPNGQSGARQISESGRFISGSTTLPGDLWIPVLWDDRRIIVLGVLQSGLGSSSGGTNDSGEVVGTASIQTGPFREERGFVWRRHVMHDVNDLLLDGVSDEWLVTSGRDINESGQLLMHAYARSRDLRLPVRLDPVDEGLTVWSFAPNQPGASNTLEVIHATPRGRVVFVAGTARGEAHGIPQCPGATIETVNAQVIGTAIADAEGRATLTRFIPASLAGRRFVVLAIDWSTCEASPPGFIQIQP